MVNQMNCGIGLVVVGLVLFILAILLITEKNRFTPFYTPVKCDNLFLDIPVKYTLHVVPTMVNGTMTDGDYLVTVMGAAGSPLANTGNTLVATAPRTTAAEFAAAPFVPVSTTCDNKNEFEVTLFSKTAGKVWMAHPATPTDYSTYFPIGDTTIVGDTMIEVQTKKAVVLGLKMQTVSPLTKALFAAVGVPQPGVTGVCPDGPGVCTAPLFFDLDVKSEVEAGMLGMWLGISGLTFFENLLPKKYCSQYVKFRADALGEGYLTTAGPTYCRDTPGDIIAKMMASATHAEAVAGTAGPSHTTPVKGHIDQFDPLKEDLDSIESLVMTLLTVFIILYFLLVIVCWGFGAMKIKAAMDEPKDAPAQHKDLEAAA